MFVEPIRAVVIGYTVPEIAGANPRIVMLTLLPTLADTGAMTTDGAAIMVSVVVAVSVGTAKVNCTV